MAEKRKKLEIHRTPRGVAVYPWLNKPDTKWNPDGEYRVTLRLSETDAAPLKAIIDEAHAQAVDAAIAELKTKAGPKAKTPKIKLADKPYGLELNDEGEETGHMLFRFKQKAKGTTKKGEVYERKVVLWDARGAELKGKSVYGGSEIRVAFQAAPFYTAQVGAGVSLRLVAVQVLKLVEGGVGKTFDSCGFEAEDGYEADAADMDAAIAATDGTEGESDF